jgi:MFS family permease
VHKALDKSGAVLGPLVAYGLLSWLGESKSTYQILFIVALVPAILGVAVLSLIKDKSGAKLPRESMTETWQSMSPEFKRYLIPAAIFSLAYFSFSFLLLRAHSVGFAVKDIVLLYALFNIATVLASPLIGKFSDRVGRARLILSGYLIYLTMCLGFAFATTKPEVVALFIIFGIFYAIDEAQSKAFIADIELDRRGSAIGLYNFVTGVIYMPASLIAGALWLVHPASAFIFAASLAFTAFSVFLYLRPDRKLNNAR